MPTQTQVESSWTSHAVGIRFARFAIEVVDRKGLGLALRVVFPADILVPTNDFLVVLPWLCVLFVAL